MVTPEILIEDIFGFENPLTEIGDKKNYEYNSWRRYIFNKPIVEYGVYILYHGGEIVYIGYSKQLHVRIKSHCTCKKIEWDTFEKYILGEKLLSKFIEEFLIEYYKPTHNQISKQGRFIHETFPMKGSEGPLILSV